MKPKFKIEDIAIFVDEIEILGIDNDMYVIKLHNDSVQKYNIEAFDELYKFKYNGKKKREFKAEMESILADANKSDMVTEKEHIK